jgi:hypothetical protein
MDHSELDLSEDLKTLNEMIWTKDEEEIEYWGPE